MGFLSSIWNGIKSLFSGSFLGSTVGAISSSVNARKEREWNAEQAEINRTFQSNEAALQRDWSAAEAERARDWEEEMYDKYNSLSGKIQQAHEAGVNPMLAITGNAVSPMSTSSPMPSGASAGAVGNPTGSFVNIIGEMLGLQKLQAETRLINSEADNLDKNTSWIDRLNEASLNMTDAEIMQTLKDIEVKDNAILVGNAEIEVKASEVALNKIVGSLREMEATQIREMLPYIKALNEAETDAARADAAYKLAAATLAGEQASRTDTGETLDVVNTVVDGVGDVVTTGVLIMDMVGEIFGVEDAGQRWQETKRFERDSKGRITSVTREGDGKSKKITKKRRKRR